MSEGGAAPDGPTASAEADRERKRRNAAILLVVLGLLGLAVAGLGLVLLEVTADRRGDYRGASSLEAPAPDAAPLPNGVGSRDAAHDAAPSDAAPSDAAPRDDG